MMTCIKLNIINLKKRYREAVWKFHSDYQQSIATEDTEDITESKSRSNKSTKPIECHFTFSDRVTEEAGLGALLDSQNQVVRKNRDGKAVVRLYGATQDEVSRSKPKYSYLGVEIDYMAVHQDKWVEETVTLLREKENYFTAQKKEEL